jgi:monoamine oxidase
VKQIIIIGAGLSGLSSAYALKESHFEIEILEARDRPGGRIYTRYEDQNHLEMGATWFGPQHTSLIQLIHELNIPFKQQDNGREAIYDFRPQGYIERFQIPKQQAPTYKFKNGSSQLIKVLQEEITAPIHFNQQVISITHADNFEVKTQSKCFFADYVIVSLPPQLVTDSITFQPQLTESSRSLLSKTHTWMSDSIKFSMGFDSAFWKTNSFIGTLMSPQQIVQEMYDHSDAGNSQHALVGFLNSEFAKLSQKERQDKVIKQLQTTFPKYNEQLLIYNDVNWRNEKFTIHPNAASLLPHQHNGHPKLRTGFYQNKLFFTASETAKQTPGYMDGAVQRGREVAQLLLNL